MPRVTPPEVDRVAASRAAVAARRARAAVKKAVATRQRSAVDVLDVAWTDDPPQAEASLRVRELLTSIPTLGPTRAARVMTSIGIADSKRVGGLGTRQRVALRAWIVERESRAKTKHRLVVLAGPTAVGKGAVSGYIREHHPEVLFSVSATTRPPRPGEIDGVHYAFVSDAEFDRMVEAGEFLEHATVHNAYRYGTPRPAVERALGEGRSVLLEIDLQGARMVAEAMPDALLVFLAPPSWDELVRRLTGRGTESPEEQERRLETAKVELEARDEFDVVVVNRTVSEAAAEVVSLLASPGAIAS